jgi:hypothetical protein
MAPDSNSSSSCSCLWNTAAAFPVNVDASTTSLRFVGTTLGCIDLRVPSGSAMEALELADVVVSSPLRLPDTLRHLIIHNSSVELQGPALTHLETLEVTLDDPRIGHIVHFRAWQWADCNRLRCMTLMNASASTVVHDTPNAWPPFLEQLRVNCNEDSDDPCPFPGLPSTLVSLELLWL